MTTPDSSSVFVKELHKRWFDNVKEYLEKKRERTDQSSNGKKIKASWKYFSFVKNLKWINDMEERVFLNIENLLFECVSVDAAKSHEADIDWGLGPKNQC